MRSVNHLVPLGLILLTAASSGCGPSSGTAKPIPASIPEASWQAQVEAVRSGATDRIEATQVEVGDEELRELEQLTGLRELLIDRGRMTDRGLASLAQLPKLEHVRLRGVKLTDASLQQLCAIPTLQRLNVPQADFSDDGLAALGQLNQLQLLRFASPRVTAAGIAHLTAVPSLRWLHLIDIPVGDAAVTPITQLPKLESLYLDGATISDQGYDQLFRARPELHVHVDQKHHDRDPHGHSH